MSGWFVKGMMIAGGLIAAIGSQNAFVLKQGLLRQNVAAVTAVCFLCDFVLMTAGVFGMGGVFGKSPAATAVLSGLGGLFLLWYGFCSFRRAFFAHDALSPETGGANQSTRAAVASALAVTLLNPHVYLDTVVIVGGVAAPLSADNKILFLCGALTVSFVWFAALGFGARLLLPLFQSPRAWQILEFAVGCMMWWIAGGLFYFLYRSFGAA